MNFDYQAIILQTDRQTDRQTDLVGTDPESVMLNSFQHLFRTSLFGIQIKKHQCELDFTRCFFILGGDGKKLDALQGNNVMEIRE